MYFKFVKKTETIPYTAASALAAGDVVFIGTLACVAHHPVDSGDTAELYFGGGLVYEVPVTAGTAITQGAALYWNSTSHVASATSTGNTAIGKAYTAASSTATSVLVVLNA
mgnify:CR=1 FL=1